MTTYANLADAQAAYLANADYADGSGDTTKAQAFRSATRALLLLLPAGISQSGASRSHNTANLNNQLAMVESWIASNVKARVLYADVQDFRD